MFINMVLRSVHFNNMLSSEERGCGQWWGLGLSQCGSSCLWVLLDWHWTEKVQYTLADISFSKPLVLREIFFFFFFLFRSQWFSVILLTRKSPKDSSIFCSGKCLWAVPAAAGDNGAGSPPTSPKQMNFLLLHSHIFGRDSLTFRVHQKGCYYSLPNLN